MATNGICGHDHYGKGHLCGPTELSVRRKAELLAVFLGHITVKVQRSIKDIELLAISKRPCHLPRELCLCHRGDCVLHITARC